MDDLDRLIEDLTDEWLARLPEDQLRLAQGVREAFNV